MDIEEFRKKRKCKENIKTIKGWLEKGYIRGAKRNPKTNEWDIPSEAIPPYTRCGKVTGGGIYKSIARGVLNERDVLAQLYNMPEKRFKEYIKLMLEKDYLKTYECEGITYYIHTFKTQSLLNMPKSDIIKLVEGIAEGVTTAALKLA